MVSPAQGVRLRFLISLLIFPSLFSWFVTLTSWQRKLNFVLDFELFYERRERLSAVVKGTETSAINENHIGTRWILCSMHNLMNLTLNYAITLNCNCGKRISCGQRANDLLAFRRNKWKILSLFIFFSRSENIEQIIPIEGL